MAEFDGAGGAQTFLVALGDNLVIDNFGTFGTGSQPAVPAELDTLAFSGAGLTARNMILRQAGSDVVVTFSGVANTSVTFTSTTIETLENIAGAGNFRFDGEASVTNSINVWRATQQQSTISQTSVVTFLNDLANDVTGNKGNDVINGQGGNDHLRGAAGDDLLRGGDGDDILNGGKGNDQLSGGLGNDIYIVDSTGDVVVEGPANSIGGGFADEVRSSVNFSIFSHRNIERLSLTGTADINGTGNDVSNVITGNSGKNVLNGGDGNDTVSGKGGDDTLIGGRGSDTLTGGAGNDVIDGGTWSDTAVFAGTMDGYEISKVGNEVHVIDIDFVDGDDGADHLSNVEFLQLKDGKLATSEIAQATIVDADVGANTVLEGAADGTPVGITAAAKDAPSDIVFSLSDSAGGLFAIDEVTGVVTVADGQALDHEANTERSITVRATVPGTGSFTEKSFTIAIGDVTGDGLSNIDLLDLAPERGFEIAGARAYDQSGNSVSSAGDFNGDGFDDLIIGASYATPFGRERAGESYLVFGTKGGPGDVDLATLTASGGFKISGAAATDYSGASVSSAGDVNGDGLDDLIIGAYRGRSYVVFGTEDGHEDIDLAALTAAQGIKIVPGFPGASASSVSSAGDINGDGIDDLVIGIDRRDPYGQLAGQSYVIYGTETGLGNIDLEALTASQGFKISGGAPGDRSGASVSSAGDINGDGIDDLAVGAPHGSESHFLAGQTYVVYGRKGGLDDVDLAALTTSQGFTILGGATGDQSGSSVSPAGDVNNDGIADLIVGAPTAGGDNAGESYVIYGKEGGLDEIDLAALTSSQGFKISGIAFNDRSGISVSSAGDVNGDGIDDLIVGAHYADPSGRDYAGQSYLIYGKEGGLDDVDLATLTASQGFKISGGAERDFSGTSVNAAGDINGDGFADMVVGARRVDPLGRAYAGETYVIYGGDFTGSVTQLGTSGDDLLEGTADDDAFVGGLGNDVLGSSSGSGVDSFHGGAGDDVVVQGFGELQRVDGGSGIDTLRANEFGGSIDLTGNLRDRVEGIEIIDLVDDFTSNSLTIDSSNITHMSGSNGSAFGANTVLIKGGGEGQETDLVNLTDSGWIISGEVVNPFGQSGTYTKWTNGAATALIETGIQVSAIGQIDLADLSPEQGFTITGAALGDAAGSAVSTIGDVNNDGIDDVIVGASRADLAGADAGASYVIYGKAGGLGDIDLASLAASDGFKISGGASGDGAGSSVSDAGDVNGDGIADLVVGARGADPLGRTGAGETYVIYGKTGGPGDIDLSALTLTQGFAIAGAFENSYSATSLNSAGDVNGDGLDDLIFSAPSAAFQYGGGPTETFVIYGKVGGVDNIDLATLSPTQGFRVVGDSSIISVSGIGDINGDGLDDIALGGGLGVPGRGYVVFGKADMPDVVDLTALSTSDGFRINPFDDFTESSGLVVSAAGDINGDGFEDLAVADAEQGPYSGRTAVIYGKLGGPGEIDLSTLTPAQGFSIIGAAAYDHSGRYISSAGDVNGDGIDDLLIGAPYADPGGRNDAGEAYLIFGKAGGLGDIDLATLTPDQGLKISGADERDVAGTSVSTAGDINGDGFADLIVGAPEWHPLALGNGKAYVLYGGDLTGAVTHLGTDGGDTLSGSAAEEHFVGGLGNDLLEGGGGADSFLAGAGDDAIHVTDGSFRRADGGNGYDTLHLDFSGAVDLGNIDGDAATADHAKIRGIEAIDFDNGSANQITVELVDVLEIDADSADLGGVASLDNVLKIDGDTGDSLSLDPVDGWSAADTSTLPGYAIYTAGNAKIAVDQDIAVAVA